MDLLVALVLVRSDGTPVGALPSFTASTPWWLDVDEFDGPKQLRDTAQRAKAEKP